MLAPYRTEGPALYGNFRLFFPNSGNSSMSFPTRKGVSEFTRRAIGDIVKRMEELTGFSMSDLYRMLAGETPDHLDYARDLHRGLCVAKPDAAREYRELLDADAELMRPAQRTAGTQTDAYAVANTCQKVIDTIIREGQGKAEGEDVLSAVRRAHALMGAFIKSEEAKTDVRPRLKEIR
jgi:hypothetical protein